MNFKKVEKAAKKINQLLDNMRDEEQVSKIEKDLLLSYIRDLYEKVIQTKDSSSSNKDTDNRSARKEETKPVIPEPIVQMKAPTPPPVVEIADVVRQELQDSNNHSDQTPIENKIEATSSPQNVIYDTPKQVDQVEEIVASNNNAPQELLELFEKGSISELSDKLSQSPISDLTKCMGINERIFTVNELFGGDTGLFINTMQELDKLNSLEQARDYLVNNVAVKQNWSDPSKIKKTTNFVKLISRRY